MRSIKLQSSPQKKKPTQCWREDHARAALEFAQNHKAGLAVQLMLTLGLRCSEMLGLRWDDFDLFAGTVHIQRAATMYAGVVVVGDVKTENSDRVLPLPSWLIERIKEARMYKGRRREGYLFPMASNPRKPMSTAYYTKHYINVFMQDLEEATGVPAINCHGLRHTCGTVLWDKTRDLLAVSKTLGHSTLEITKRFYVHEDVEMLRRHIAPAMEDLKTEKK